MSGHSKWAKTHREKAATDAKKGALFTKLSNAITLAAKEKGGNLDTNFTLKLAIDKAKSSNMPKDNIERAIKKGTGELEGEQIMEIIYEGFGPGGVPIIIEALTDNKNRISANMKHILSKYGGSLGTSGSVSWMFERKGVIFLRKLSNEVDKEELELKLIDAGAEDIKEKDGQMIVICPIKDLQKVKEALENEKFDIEDASLEWIPKETINLQASDKGKIEKLFNSLDEDEDVKDFYTNVAEYNY